MKIPNPRKPAALRAVTLAALGGIGLAACGSTGYKAATSPSPTPAASAPAPTPSSTAAPGSTPATSAPGAAAAAPAGAMAVTIGNFAFVPPTLTVKVGTTVTWTNKDEEPHTVVGGGMKSPVLGNAGSTYSHTFTTAGTFAYNCSIHPFMHGMVTVTA